MNPELKKEIGKYLVDVSKLLIGGLVLSTVLKIEGLSNVLIIIGGIIVTAILAIWGFILINDKNK